MARTEKKSRIKGIPPRVFLTLRDSATGSYPQNSHDNIIEVAPIGPFVDNIMLPFTSSVVYYGLGIPTGSIHLPSLSSLTGSLTGSSKVRAGISDTFLDISKNRSSSSLMIPFRDSGQQAADKRASTDPFWTTGSSVGSFTAPLWSKNKIEIDFSPLTASSLTGSRGGQSGSSYMGYYNFTSKKWDALRPSGIETGKLDPGGVCSSSTSPNYNHLLWGFSASHNKRYSANQFLGINSRHLLSRGRPMSSFGFPWSGIFESTSSSMIPMSKFINKPFVVEKIYIEMSASFRLCTLNGTLNNTKAYDGSPFYENGHYSSSYVINNIFLLNQRKSPVVKNMETAKIVSFAAGPALNNRQLQYSSSVSTRDLVGWFDIASYNTEVQFGTDDTTHPEYFNRDVTIKSSAITPSTASWSQYLIMSGVAKSPKATKLTEGFDGGLELEFNPLNNTAIENTFYNRIIPTFIVGGWWPSRNGMPFTPSGRDGKSTQIKYDGDVINDGTDESFQVGDSSANWEIENSYLLLPSDNLILGWQLPTHDDISGALNSLERYPTGSYVEFPIAPAKIILYGSYVSQGEAVNDTFTQVLTSDSIHEEIG